MASCRRSSRQLGRYILVQKAIQSRCSHADKPAQYNDGGGSNLMKFLAINCGSSTLKFRLFESDMPNGLDLAGSCLASGNVDRIDTGGSVSFQHAGETVRESAVVADHAEAIRQVFIWLNTSGLLKSDGLGSVGHRVVHGGDRFVEPTLLNEQVLDALKSLG